MKIKFSIFLIIFFLSFNVNAEQKEIETIIANGMGTSIQDAAQNAAENALTQAVGSFIDATTMMEKRTEIADGVVSRSKVINKDIKEYSQGSIQYFEILDTTETSGIFRLTARVDVRIEDFRAYIKELASGTQKVGAGLFAQMDTEQDNTEDRLSLVIDKILLPIMAGEVHNIDIDPPMTMTQMHAKYPDYTNWINGMARGQKHSNIAIFLFNISLVPEFFENMTNIFENVSDSKKTLSGWESINKFAEYRKDNTFIIIDNYEKGYASAKSYVLDGFDEEARIYLNDKFDYGDWMLIPSKMNDQIYYNDYYDGCTWNNDLIFKVLDANSKVIKSEVMLGCVRLNGAGERTNGESLDDKGLANAGGNNEEPTLSLYAATAQHAQRKIFAVRSYWLFFELSPDVRKKAARVELSYVQN